jgi:outer membrane protein assembly factor BamB
LTAGLAASCGGGASHPHAVIPTAAPPSQPQPQQSTAGRKPARLVITVIDGDLWRRIPRARVRVLHQAGETSTRGVMITRVPHRGSYLVRVSAPAYESRTVQVDFRGSRRQTVRIYQRKLQWPLYGATLNRTQAQDTIRLHPPFRSVWSVDVGGLIEFPAVVDEGTAYVGNAHETIYAISMASGQVLWRHPTPHGEMAASPAVFGDELVYHGLDGNVWVLKRTTGAELWHFVVGSPIESSPIVYRGVDYFGAWNGNLYALDLSTRKLRWTHSLGAKITSSASIGGSVLYIGDYAGRLWALSTNTGATQWTATVNGRIYGTPAVAGGLVFVGSSDGDSVTAFTTRGGFVWRVNTGSYVYSSPAVSQGRVFFGSYGGGFYCVSAGSGRVLWTVNAGGPISGAPAVVDGVAYAGSFSNHIVGVAVRTGRVVEQFPHGEYVPVSGNGMYLLFHGYSALYAVTPR